MTDSGSDRSAEAARWFARHRAGALAASDAASFDEWMRDADARDAYRRVEAMWDAIGMLDGHPEIVEIQERTARRRRRSFWPAAMILGAAAASVATILVLPRTPPVPVATVAQVEQRFESGVGQRKPIVLADGSVVTLDTDSAISVSMQSARRQIVLERGRAYFDVAKAPDRPFVVRANGQSVIAVGTSFSVGMERKGLDVILVEGRVRVVPTTGSATGNRVEMIAGDRLSVSSDGQWTLRKTDARQETTWRDGRLVFDEARLADVAEALNRYSDRKIIFADPAIGDRRISAVLRTDDVASFTAAIETMGIGRVRRGGSDDRIVIEK